MTMASDHQVALTRGHRGNSTQLNRAGRQVVPAFLQKLYEMVNESANDDLIRWSDTGDSFFVLDHERFAREVLGRWFKHQNFASFVRQLNMYGFHKIPHLQQGVLRSETDTELWNFEHPNFHRGQPDMLCLIQRKKQAAQLGEDPSIDIRDATHFTATSPAANLSPGQILDINSIVNGLAAIKRHQTTISADLNELKSSNQLLWQEALTARERHKKHQDTINRILKFLAGVFGHHAGSVHKEDAVDHSPSRSVVPRIPQRLMIEVGPSRKGKGVGIAEEEDQDMPSQTTGRNFSPTPSDQFSTIETLASAASPSVPLSETFSPALADLSTTFDSKHLYPQGSTGLPTNPTADPSPISNHPNPQGPPLPESSHPTEHNATLINPTPPQPYHPDGTQACPPTVSPSATTSPAPTQEGPDQTLMQTAIADMLRSPSQFHRLLAALAPQTSYSLPDPVSGIEPQAFHSELTPYEPPYDTYRGLAAEPNGAFNPVALLAPAPQADLEAAARYRSVADNASRLRQTHEDAEELTKDVESKFTSLIESLGLDTSVMDDDQLPGAAGVATDTPAAITPALSSGMDETNGDSSGLDFDFDAFLNEMGNDDENNYIDHVDCTAFLDEVPSPSDGRSSPVASLHQDSPNFIATRKRKSDIAEDQQHTKSSNYTLSAPKSKRKR